MNAFQKWAQRWNLSPQALIELATALEQAPTPQVPAGKQSEAATQAAVRLAAPHMGAALWRNNVGVLWDDTGRPVRYGLANDSKAVNKRTKSGDLIGIYPVAVTAQHVGRTLGVFVSIECKRGDWVWGNTPREVAQRHWVQLIQARGGLAGFVRDTTEFNTILRGVVGNERYIGVK